MPFKKFSLPLHSGDALHTYSILIVRGRAIGKGIDFPDIGIKNGITFYNFSIRKGTDFEDFDMKPKVPFRKIDILNFSKKLV